MLPCENITVSLGGIDKPNQPFQDLPIAKASGCVTGAETARVLHLDHFGEYSFIEAGFWAKLHAKAHGPGTPLPPIDDDSRVILRWHYPSLDTVEQTTHRVMKDISFPVILRKNDWIAPMMQLLSQEQQQPETTRCPVQEDRDDEMDLQAASETSGEGSHWDPSSPATPESTVDGDWQMNCVVHQDMKPQQPEIELVDSECDGSVSKDQRRHHYWEWSQREQTWFHQDPNGLIRPFPGLD